VGDLSSGQSHKHTISGWRHFNLFTSKERDENMLYYNIAANEFLVLEKKADCQGVGPGQSLQRIFQTKHEATIPSSSYKWTDFMFYRCCWATFYNLRGPTNITVGAKIWYRSNGKTITTENKYYYYWQFYY
jgi:hypothetical protein